MGFEIELKEDSPEKLAAVAGKPTKYYLSAPEFMAFVDYVNGLNLQQILNVDNSSTLGIEVAGLTLSGKINFVTSLITSLRNVSFPDKDGTVAYLDDIAALLEGLAWKQPVELAFETAVAQSGAIPQLASLTNQGVTLVNNSRIILMAQPNPIYNGFWRVNSTPVSGFYRLYRTDDANTTSELNNAVVVVSGGTHIGKSFRQSTVNPIIGTSNIVFQDFGAAVATATDTIPGISKLYNAIGTQTDGGITPNAVLLALALKQNTLAFTSYSSGTTTIGWSSFAQKTLWYIDFGTHCLFFYHFEGPGNGINSSFTIPYTATENSTSQHIVMSNGSYFNNPGRGVISSGSNVVNLYATIPGSTWSAGSSNKIASGLILIKK